MNQIKVWFNKSGLSNYAVIESIKASAQPGEEFFFIVTHHRAGTALSAIADLFSLEPDGLKGDQYVDWCLEFATTNGVQIFFPDRSVRDLAAQRGRFNAAGVHLMVPTDHETLDTLDHKGTQYELIGKDIVDIPDYKIVTNLSQFEEACDDLYSRHERICFKPAVSIFGAGFRALTEEGSAITRLMNGNNTALSMAEARFIFGAEESFRDLMVMEYLPGPEISVDCLALKGEVVRAICRSKIADRMQQVIDNAQTLAATAKLAKHLNLNGIFNAQFRHKDGVYYLLEINARMSGGLYVTFHSGVSLPYWAIRLALGTAQPSDVPKPESDVSVGQMHRSVVVPDCA